jgi:hypothetical protein
MLPRFLRQGCGWGTPRTPTKPTLFPIPRPLISVMPFHVISRQKHPVFDQISMKKSGSNQTFHLLPSPCKSPYRVFPPRPPASHRNPQRPAPMDPFCRKLPPKGAHLNSEKGPRQNQPIHSPKTSHKQERQTMQKARSIPAAVSPAQYRQAPARANQYGATVPDRPQASSRFLLPALPGAIKEARFPGGRLQCAAARSRRDQPAKMSPQTPPNSPSGPGDEIENRLCIPVKRS